MVVCVAWASKEAPRKPAQCLYPLPPTLRGAIQGNKSIYYPIIINPNVKRGQLTSKQSYTSNSFAVESSRNRLLLEADASLPPIPPPNGTGVS